MPHKLPPLFGVLASLVLALSAFAQETGFHWQQDIESAKALARQSGRLVLIHVVADGCGPCRALESNVFNQPGVAAAIEQRFVPVKLNANEYPAIAQGFGITRVPTDVIITPEGQIVGKQISPATPSSYVADTTNFANQYASQSGQAYHVAAAAAPNPATLNAAYANLAIGAPAQPVGLAQAPGAAAPASTAPATGSYNLFSAPANTQPAVVTNTYAAPAAASTALPPAAAAVNPANPAANPYLAYAPPTAANITPPNTPQPPSGTTPPQYGYEPEHTPAMTVPAQGPPATNYGFPADTSVPPSAPSNPTSEQALAPSMSQPATAAPDPTKLPPGAPPLGFDGYCPVSMRRNWQWTPGDPRYGAIHRGRTYWFTGPQEQQEFLARPDDYSPVLAGVDPVLAIDHHQTVAGIREHSLDYDGKFYLFSSEATLQQFTSNPERYASGVREAMGPSPNQQTR